MGLMCWVEWACVAAVAVSVVSYLVFFILDSYIFCEQNLKKKYKAEWAVVTGASSGIGKAICEKLANQGINVVMVALDDDMFAATFKQIKKDYPGVQFRNVGVDLGKPGYLQPIINACADIQPNLIFNNAGYIRTGLFADSPLASQMANYECNATAPLQITHHFVNVLLDNKMRGAIFFTSSPAGLIPNPTCTLYGATKSFLTSFATSLAPEIKNDGIDVLVVHPSPVNTQFYSGNLHDHGAMRFFQRTATTPQTIASCFFRSIGRTIVHDQGYFPIATRMLLKLLDYNFLAWIIALNAHTSADFVKSKRVRGGPEPAKKRS